MTTLGPHLKALNSALEGFLALLEEESIALVSENSEQLEALTHQRHGASQQLAENWRQLAELLGLPGNASLPALRMRAFVDTTPSSDWQRLEKLTAEAARLNRVNGRLIEEQMRRTQAAMQVLQSASTRNLYGADGRLSDLLNINRSIDSA
jgi:flagellar biosynthesis/type III secretory pathway chaperone